MFDLSQYDFQWGQWGLLAVCAFLVGVGKTGVPGIGIVIVPLMAMIFPAQKSVGFLLPMLVFADLFAAGYYRRHAEWKHVFQLLPWAGLGVVAGYVGLRCLKNHEDGNDLLRLFIGLIVLVMLVIHLWQQYLAKGSTAIPTNAVFAASMGFAAGATSMMANAAGPVMVLYLLAMQLPKTEFVSTGAWFFFVVNWMKVPFQLSLGNISLDSFGLNLVMFPLIVVGAGAGILLLKKMPQKAFNITIQLLAAAAAIKLIVSC